MLAEDYRARIESNRIQVYIIKPQTPERLKIKIFHRLNTGGTKLNNQEVRNCFASPELRELLKAMSENTHFLAAVNKSKTLGPTRMGDIEVCLRFISFRMLLERGELLSENIKLRPLLDQTNIELSKSTRPEKLAKYKNLFGRAMENAYFLFEKRAFRRYRPKELHSNKARAINKQLFTTWSVILSRVTTNELSKSGIKKYFFTDILAEALERDEEFSTLIDNWRPENIQPLFRKCAKLLERHIGRDPLQRDFS